MSSSPSRVPHTPPAMGQSHRSRSITWEKLPGRYSCHCWSRIVPWDRTHYMSSSPSRVPHTPPATGQSHRNGPITWSHSPARCHTHPCYGTHSWLPHWVDATTAIPPIAHGHRYHEGFSFFFLFLSPFSLFLLLLCSLFCFHSPDPFLSFLHLFIYLSIYF